MRNEIRGLLEVKEKIALQVEERLEEFERLRREADQRELFKELVFCLLTPQSKAEEAWRATEELFSTGLAFSGSEVEVAEVLKRVRFRNAKARYVVRARRFFFEVDLGDLLRRGNAATLREFLRREVLGYGLKESSHFLRNVGFYEEVAILDRHVLRSLKDFGVIASLPKSLSRRTYLEIEHLMKDFSERVGIPFPYLDFVFWYLKTGRIFK